MDKISSEVAGDLVQVVKAANATNTSQAALHTKLQDTTRIAFERMEHEMKDLLSLSGNSTDQVAHSLAHRIDHDKNLRNAFSNEEKIAPRSMAKMLVKAAKIGLSILDKYLQEGEAAEWLCEYFVIYSK